MAFDPSTAVIFDESAKKPAFDPSTAVLADDRTNDRTWGEFGKDVGLSAVQGLDTPAKLPAMAYDKATTGDWYGPETQKISAMSDEREKLKSEHAQAKNKDKAAKAQEAGNAAREYVGDGPLGTAAQVAAEFGSSFWESLKDPASIPEFAANQLAQLGAMGKVGKGAEIAANAAAKAAPRIAATKAGQAALSKAGTAGAVGFGAGLQGVDVGSDTMQRLMALPDDLWAQNPDYVALAGEIGPEAAKQKIASQLSGDATLKAAAVSLATAAMPGGSSIERALVGKSLGGHKAVPKAFVGEAAQEGAEEGSGKYFGNTSVQEVNPNQDAFEGVGAAAGQGAYMGGVMGGGMHAGKTWMDNRQPTTADLTGDGRIEPNAASTTKSAEDAQIDTALAEAKQPPAQPPASPAEPMGEAREVELWAKASAGTITPEEKAELAAMQQGQPAQSPASAAMPQEATAEQGMPAPEQLPPDVATPAPIDTRHPTEQAADAVVAALAQEAGIPIETVLPPSTAQQATPLPEAGAPQPVDLPPPQPGAEAGALPVDTLAQASEVPSMAPPAVEIPARPRTEKEARALRAQQQEISNAPQAAEAALPAVQEEARQESPLPEQVAVPKTEREAREQRRKTEILTPDGKKVAAQWDVVEADSIKASLKEGVSQPRDRTRAASNAQVLEIAGKPDFERLSDTSKTMDYGAPTLSADGLIVGGNGRFEGVSRAYDGPTATAYRQAVEQQAARFGLDADAIKGMKKPVLVRRITDNADTRQLAIQSNQAAGLQMSDMEQAALDAERMKSLDQIEVSDTGDIPLTSRNMQAIQQTLAGYSTNELAGMMTADGGLSQSGMRRLRNAILFSAYGKSDTLARLIESPDADMKNVGTALVRAAGKLAKVRTGVSEGSIPAEFDIAADLTAAIEKLSALRAEGKRLDEFLAQGDMFGGGLSQSERAIIQFLADNLRSAKAITEGLAGYAERVLSTQNSSGGLFGDAPMPTKTEVLNDATKRFADERAAAQSQQSIFDQPAPELHADTTGGNREVQARESGNRPDAGRQSGDEAARESEGRAGTDAGSREDADPAGVKVGAGETATKLEEQGDEGYTDPYELTETRPGTTDAQKNAGRAAIRDLLGRLGLNSLGKRNRADRGTPTVLGARLIANFFAGKPNQLVGQVAKTPQDLAALAQVYRDPRIETFRVAYLDGNKIIGEFGYTSRLPGSVHPPQDLDAKIAQGMAKFGADGFYILHNHPSGRAQPSPSDVELTTHIAAFVSGFRGHVVIDHNEYAVIDREGRSKVIQDETLNGTDFTGTPAVPHKLLGQVLSNPRAVAGFAKELQTPQGHATLVLATRPGEVQLIVDVPMGALNDTSRQGILKGKALIRRMARDSGSSGNRFIILPDGLDVKTLGVWAREGVFTDVVSADGVSYRETTTDPVKRDFIDDGRTMEVRENSDEKDGYANQTKETDAGVALFNRAAPNGNDAVAPVVVDDVTANEIVDRFIANYPGTKGMIKIVPDFAALPANVQQDARDQGSSEKDTKGAFDHVTGTAFIVQSNHTSPADFEETLFHEMLGHVGIRTLLGRGFVGELQNIFQQIGGLEGLAKIARARGFDKEFGEYVRGVAKARGQNEKYTLAIAKAVLSEEVFAHMAQQKPKLLDRLKALVGMLRQNLRDLGFKRLAEYGETDLLWMLQRAKVKLQNGKADGRGGWTVLKSAYGNGNGDNNSLGLTGGKPASPQPDRPNETIFRFLQRRGQDKLNRFTVIKDWLAEQGVKLSELADVYKAEERMHSRFANKAEDFREKRVKPLVEKIQKAGFSMDDVAQFLHAQHAQERNAQVAKVNQDRPDGGSGMTNTEAKAIMAKASPELAKLANEFRAIADDTLAVLVNSGMVSKEQAAAYRAAYQHYVPLKGGPDDGSQTGTGKGLSTRHKIKRALGHEMREGGEWIIENILADHQRAIMLAEKNRVGIHLLNMAVEAGRADLLTIDKPKKRQVLKENVAYEVLHKGQVIGTFDSQEAARLFRGQAMSLYKSSTPSHFSIRRTADPAVILMASPMPADNEVIVYVHGHEIRVQINDELLARAYKNMGTEAMNAVIRVGAGLNAFFSRIYTGYNPEFIVTNIVRDFTTGLANITGEQGVAMASKAAKNYAARFVELFKYAYTGTETKWVKMYREDGGNTGAAYLTDLERLGKEIQTEYAAYRGVTANLKDGDYKNAARAAGRKVFDKSIVWIERLNQAGENAMRLAVYQAMVESGRTRNEAASAAKNATVNFNRKGELGQQANALWLFFNAGVQGTAAIAHAHAKGKHRKQAWAFSSTLMGLGYLLSLAAAGDDEDKYEKTSEYERSRNLLIKAGDGFGKIPLPYGYGFFWNMGRGMADAQRTGELGKMPWHVAASFVEEFTPFGATVAGKEPSLEQAFLYIMPTVGQIAGAPILNRSGMGGDLMPDSKFDPHQPDREKMFRATRGTMADNVAGALEAAGLDVSPETVKHLARTFTGGAGSFAQSAVDLSILKAAGADVEVKEIPFARKFYTVPDVRGARGRYYEAKTEAEKSLSELNRARKTMDADKVATVVDEQYEMIRMAKLAERWSKMTGAARDRADAIRLTGTYTKAEERAMIRQMEREEEAMYDEYMSYFKEAKREAKTEAARRAAAK